METSRIVKRISYFNNKDLEDYVEEYGKELDKFRAYMRKDRVTNARNAKRTYWEHQKSLEKAEEY